MGWGPIRRELASILSYIVSLLSFYTHLARVPDVVRSTAAEGVVRSLFLVLLVLTLLWLNSS